MQDDSTIHVKKCRLGWYYVLICPKNKKTVAMSGRYYRDPLEMIADLKSLSSVGDARRFNFYFDKANQYRFRIRINCRVLLKSEAYTQQHNCWDGFNSAIKAYVDGRVTCLACENSDIVNLSELPEIAEKLNWFNDKP